MLLPMGSPLLHVLFTPANAAAVAFPPGPTVLHHQMSRGLSVGLVVSTAMDKLA